MTEKHTATINQLLNRVAERLTLAHEPLTDKCSLVGQLVPIINIVLPLLPLVPFDRLLSKLKFIDIIPKDADGWMKEERAVGELIHALAADEVFLTAINALDMYLFKVLGVTRPSELGQALLAAALDQQRAAPSPSSSSHTPSLV